MKPKSRFEAVPLKFNVVTGLPGQKPAVTERETEQAALATVRMLLVAMGSGSIGGIYPVTEAGEQPVRRVYQNEDGEVREVDLGVRKVIR